MSRMVEFIMNGRPASIEFVSRYCGENDYKIRLDDGFVGRVRVTDDGEISSQSEHLTPIDAEIGIRAYLRDEELRYKNWREENARLFAERKD